MQWKYWVHHFIAVQSSLAQQNKIISWTLAGTFSVTTGGHKQISQAVRHNWQGGGHADMEKQGAHMY